MQLVLFIITPVIVLMGILAKSLVIVLFTSKWLPIIPIFQIICFTGVLYPIHMYNLLVLQVKGRSDLVLKLEIIKKIILAIILVISFFYGFYALLWGQLLFSLVALLINTHYAGRMLGYNMFEQIKDIFPIFILGSLMGSFVFWIDSCLNIKSHMLRLIVGSLSGVLTYIFGAFIFKFGSIDDIKKLLQNR